MTVPHEQRRVHRTMRLRLARVSAFVVIGSTPMRAIAQDVDCGIFDADRAIVRFRVTGGGTQPLAGGDVIKVQDDFSGAVIFRRQTPDSKCAQPDVVLPFMLVHHWELVGANGGKTTLDLAGSTSRTGINIPLFSGGVNPVGGVWFLSAGGNYPGTEVRTPAPGSGEPTTTTQISGLPWALEAIESAIVPNLPIPKTSPASITHEVTHHTHTSLKWTVEVTVTHTPDNKNWIDPCYVYGSIVGCEDQTLGESIPITGVPFRLHYRSNRFGTPNAQSAWTYRALSLGGWSFSVHHSYDPSGAMLYLGDGSTRPVPRQRWRAPPSLPDPSSSPAPGATKSFSSMPVVVTSRRSTPSRGRSTRSSCMTQPVTSPLSGIHSAAP